MLVPRRYHPHTTPARIPAHVSVVAVVTAVMCTRVWVRARVCVASQRKPKKKVDVEEQNIEVADLQFTKGADGKSICRIKVLDTQAEAAQDANAGGKGGAGALGNLGSMLLGTQGTCGVDPVTRTALLLTPVHHGWRPHRRAGRQGGR